MSDKDDQIELVVEGLKKIFGDVPDGSRFVDVSRIPLLCASIINQTKAIEEINRKLDDKYVRKDEFLNIQRLVYGFVGLILTGVVIAILMLVVHK